MLSCGATRNEIRRHDEDSNQPMQKYRCSYKAFKWSKHSQKRKLWVFLQYGGREMYYSYSFQLFIFHINLEVVIFIFSFHARQEKIQSTNECMRTSNLSD